MLNDSEYGFSLSNAVVIDGVIYVQSIYTGQLYVVDSSIYTDNNSMDNYTIYSRVTSTIEDDGSYNRKFYRSAILISDLYQGSPVLTYCNDDYNNQVDYRTFDTSSFLRSKINRLGSAYRRSWEIEHTDDTPFRAEAIEIDFDIGRLE